MQYNLTLDEKLKLLTGKNGWQTDDFNGKIPSIFMADGPHGLRKCQGNEAIKSTAMPTLSLLACSWDRNLAYFDGQVIADECVENDVDILLAPGINMKRSPLCGRNFEYFSEDPYLSGELAKNYIKGVQDKHVGTSLKHFALNNSENFRFEQNVEVDDRTFFDLYLRAFKIALESNPYTIMCSYNLVHGVYASENKRLLEDILRNKFGFEGVIVSDWCAVKSRVRALKATLDLQMPFDEHSFEELKCAYENGVITDNEIDQSVNRLLELIQKVLFDRTQRKIEWTKEERHENAVKIAQESIVLLKNKNNLLPLDRDKITDLYPDQVSEYVGGGGSSFVSTLSPIKRLGQVLKEKGIKVNNHGYYEAIHNRYKSEYKIFCIGNNNTVEAEDFDRRNIFADLNQRYEQALINASTKFEKIIVIIYSGSVIDCSKWIDNVDAVIYAGFGGEGVNEALYKILYGEVNPSGKLAESWGKTLELSAVDISKEIDNFTFYKERFDIGYRFFDKNPDNIRFAFGYGLSYSSFEYSNLKIEQTGETDFTLKYDIKNRSNIDGKEISQVYVSRPYSRHQMPLKELKGFSKDLIKAGETKTIEIRLDKTAFESFNWSIDDYYVENGDYKIYVASSSQDIKLTEILEIKKDERTQFSVKCLIDYPFITNNK